MVVILMMSVKLALLDFVKIKYFEIKVMMSQFLPLVSPTEFYHKTHRYCRCGHMIKVW